MYLQIKFQGTFSFDQHGYQQQTGQSQSSAEPQHNQLPQPQQQQPQQSRLENVPPRKPQGMPTSLSYSEQYAMAEMLLEYQKKKHNIDMQLAKLNEEKRCLIERHDLEKKIFCARNRLSPDS